MSTMTPTTARGSQSSQAIPIPDSSYDHKSAIMAGIAEYNDIAYLDPPHDHDPTQISHVCALPSAMLRQLPESVQDALWAMQESASIAYASYTRLQGLLQERFTRLSPAVSPDTSHFSEPSFHTYASQITAEQTYLLDEALPDFRHKSRRIDQSLCPYSNHTFSYQTGETVTIGAWWAKVQSLVNEWRDSAKTIEVPEFGDTVSEWHASQNNTPITDDGELKGFGDFSDFAGGMTGAGDTAVVSDGLSATFSSNSSNKDDGPNESKDHRSDSGVGMILEGQA